MKAKSATRRSALSVATAISVSTALLGGAGAAGAAGAASDNSTVVRRLTRMVKGLEPGSNHLVVTIHDGDAATIAGTAGAIASVPLIDRLEAGGICRKSLSFGDLHQVFTG